MPDMPEGEKPTLPPEQPQGFLARLAERAFDFFFAKPGRRRADYGRANLNVKLLAALIGCITLGWKYINSQQAAYERLVDRMVDQFGAQNKELLAALERLREAQEDTAREQRANTATVREALLSRIKPSEKVTPP
jgi:hypothetical protein